jgi:hypothetical protein
LTDDLKPRLREYLILHGVEFGTDKLFCCPFHGESVPSMGIVPDSGGTQAHCFVCDSGTGDKRESADIYTFGAHYYGLDEKRDFPEIKKRIEAELGMSSYIPPETKPKKPAPPAVTLPLEASRAVYTVPESARLSPALSCEIYSLIFAVLILYSLIINLQTADG